MTNGDSSLHSGICLNRSVLLLYNRLLWIFYNAFRIHFSLSLSLSLPFILYVNPIDIGVPLRLVLSDSVVLLVLGKHPVSGLIVVSYLTGQDQTRQVSLYSAR